MFPLLLITVLLSFTTPASPSGPSFRSNERPPSGKREYRNRWNLAKLEASNYNPQSARIQNMRGAITPGDEGEYVRRRREELRPQTPQQTSAWKSVKQQLLANSTHVPGPFYRPFVIGLCATGYWLPIDPETSKSFKAFIIDDFESKPKEHRIWKFIEFSSTVSSCFCRHETPAEYVSFWNFRECNPEEQGMLIQYHRSTNQQTAGNKVNSALNQVIRNQQNVDDSGLSGFLILNQMNIGSRPPLLRAATPSRDMMRSVSPWMRRPQSAGLPNRLLKPLTNADDRFRKLRYVNRKRSNITINRMNTKSDWEEMLAKTM